MTLHAKAFLASRKICGEDDWICEWCGAWSVASSLDVHHILYRSEGGGNEPENLIGLCRNCHNAAHLTEITKDDLHERARGILKWVKKTNR